MAVLPRRFWTEQEDLLLAKYRLQRMPDKQIAHLLGRTVQAIKKHSQKTRLLSLRARKWLPTEYAFLVEQLAAKRPIAEITAELGRTYGSVQSRINWAGLHRPHNKPPAGPFREWTTSEDRRVADRKARGFRSRFVAKELGRTRDAVLARIAHKKRAAA
jgi:predicted transcriptional regulator